MKISDKVWGHLLKLKSRLVQRDIWENFGYDLDKGFVFRDEYKNARVIFLVTKNRENEDSRLKRLIGDIQYFDQHEDSSLGSIFKLFLPLILAKFINMNRPFVIVHMAQTLDGRISTCSGKSKWIGNDENLKHAHRLRAMVDGCMVGGRTITNDLPRLNVRHVEGSNPVRLLLSNTFCDFDKLPIVPGMKTFLLRRKDNPCSQINKAISKVIYYEGQTDTEKLDDLLVSLKREGLNSFLLEGGPETVASFYNHNRIDWLQLHIAPMIFGSGKSFIQLSEINDVSEGKKLNNVFYNRMGDGIMMTGELN